MNTARWATDEIDNSQYLGPQRVGGHLYVDW
jgi:hypothetical protein